ncbi:MAG: helix-turn-helix domain-containing protein [Phycisphaerae bacterium]
MTTLAPTATVERIDGREAGPGEMPAMLTVHDVARMLNCSARTVYRLTDSGRMPRPARLRALVRWPKATIERWIEEGCPKAEDMEVIL